jgi:hypothetical protein
MGSGKRGRDSGEQ